MFFPKLSCLISLFVFYYYCNKLPEKLMPLKPLKLIILPFVDHKSDLGLIGQNQGISRPVFLPGDSGENPFLAFPTFKWIPDFLGWCPPFIHLQIIKFISHCIHLICSSACLFHFIFDEKYLIFLQYAFYCDLWQIS